MIFWYALIPTKASQRVSLLPALFLIQSFLWNSDLARMQRWMTAHEYPFWKYFIMGFYREQLKFLSVSNITSYISPLSVLCFAHFSSFTVIRSHLQILSSKYSDTGRCPCPEVPSWCLFMLKSITYMTSKWTWNRCILGTICLFILILSQHPVSCWLFYLYALTLHHLSPFLYLFA